MYNLITESETSIAAKYRHAIVRNLAWALSSPPLMKFPHSNIHWPDPNWYLETYAQTEAILRDLDKDPSAIEDAVSLNNDRRLGSYFESLWTFWLQQQHRYALLHHNLQIQDKQRTLGEFDFIVHDNETGKTCHWEVAVKFYLGVADTTKLNCWVGPGLHDRFDIKLDRLLNHQTKLAKHPVSKQLLDKQNISIDETWIILKGRLFYKLDLDDATFADNICQQHLRAWWCNASEFLNATDAYGNQWYLLEKLDWLSPVYIPDKPECSIATIIEQVNIRNEPVCVCVAKNNRELSRGFVVPGHWHQKAIEYSG